MSLKHFVSNVWRNVRDKNIDAGRETWYQFQMGVLRRITPYLSHTGTNVLDEDWDILLILDACRLDMFRDIQSEYDFDWAEESSIDSVGCHSRSWMSKTFTDDRDLSDITYICGNPFSEEFVDDSRFREIIHEWKHSWSDDLGTIRHEPLTSRAINKYRDGHDRIIVHYMQPHHPFIGDSMTSGFEGSEFPRPKDEDPWMMMRRGELDRTDVMNAYEDNLRHGLEGVQDVVNNVDADIVVTSDHGNAMGERGVFGHPDVPIDPIKKVPWYRIRAKNTENREFEEISEESQSTIDDRLKALGYK